MIKKSIFISIVLIVSWYLYVRSFPNNSAFQGMAHKNLAKAQNYIYTEKEIKMAMVGSSLSNHVSSDRLKNVFNLNFDGSTIYDGFFVIIKSEKFPKVMFVETNYAINRRHKALFEDNLFTPFHYYSKLYFRFLRIDKQPISHLNHYFLKDFNKNISESLGFVSEKSSHTMLDKLIKIHKKIYSKTLTEEKLSNEIHKLDSILCIFQKNDTKIVFYEMPVNPTLVNMPMAIQNRIALKKYCTEKEFDFIVLPENHKEFRTNDGVHLTKKESKIYTEYFLKELEKLNIRLDN